LPIPICPACRCSRRRRIGGIGPQNGSPRGAAESELATGLAGKIKASEDRRYLGLWLARADLLAGQSALGAGHAADAVPPLEEALATFTEIVDNKFSPELADAATSLASALASSAPGAEHTQRVAQLRNTAQAIRAAQPAAQL
jgi:hypothetical protein